MGAGKTTVSVALARRYHLPWADADARIEARQHKSISRIFAARGEDGFRALEAQMLQDICREQPPQIISCGGGVVQQAQNRALLKSPQVLTIYLQVSTDEAAERIHDFSSRPLFAHLDEVAHLHDAREPLYQEVADLQVQTAGQSVEALVERIAQELIEREVLIAA
jgi:shikimate kinase